MELEGRVWKDKSYWLVEVPSLNIMTQGRSKKKALEMICDAIMEALISYFSSDKTKDLKIVVNDYTQGVIGVAASQERLLLSLSLLRQREESGTTIREASKRLGSTSPTAYGQYEKGTNNMTIETYDRLLRAANPKKRSLLRVV